MKREELRTELKEFAKNLVGGYVDDTTILELLGTTDVIDHYLTNTSRLTFPNSLECINCELRRDFITNF